MTKIDPAEDGVLDDVTIAGLRVGLVRFGEQLGHCQPTLASMWSAEMIDLCDRALAGDRVAREHVTRIEIHRRARIPTLGGRSSV
jgi:hypothetical protein